MNEENLNRESRIFSLKVKNSNQKYVSQRIWKHQSSNLFMEKKSLKHIKSAVKLKFLQTQQKDLKISPPKKTTESPFTCTEKSFKKIIYENFTIFLC